MVAPITIITQTSRRLVDQEPAFEFTTWARPDLLDAFNFALGVVAQYNMGDFSKRTKVALVPGELQSLGEGCEKIIGVAGWSRNGVFLGPLSMVSIAPVSLRRRPFCTVAYRPAGIEMEGEREFRLYPPVPEGEKNLSIEASCYKTPHAEDMDTDIAVPRRLWAPILELMMYYAHAYDIEAVPSRDRAEMHWNKAMVLLGVSK